MGHAWYRSPLFRYCLGADRFSLNLKEHRPLINPLVTIKDFSWFFYWKVKKKIHLGVGCEESKSLILSRYLSSSRRYWSLNFFWFFWQCTFIYSYRLTIFVQCIANIRSYSHLFKFLSYLVWFSRYKLLYLLIFNSVWQQCNDLSWKISIC